MSKRSARDTIKLILWNRVVATLFRMTVGFVFVYACLDKIVHPDKFAIMVDNYKIVPFVFINLFAVILPWIELVIGLCLILGPFSDAASAVTGSLLVVFIVASAAALFRGLDIACGCFTTTGEGERAGLDVIIRNTFLIAMLGYSFIFDLLRKSPDRKV
ncbi:DoxX family membrane protein [bacterium]|nr:DoxX family membrane protein [bacterium]